MNKVIKLLTSFAVIFGSLTLGLCISIQGPTLMDLIDILHVNQDMMSYSLAYAGLAYSFGGFLSGFIFNYLNRQLLMATYFMIFGVANLITPWIPSYLLFSVITFSKMMAAGGTDCGSNVWILEMWPGQDAWLQALHFAFAVGTALGPVVAEPFLSPELPDEHELERLHGPNYSQQENFTMPEPGESRIYVPYSVCGFASISASIALFALYLYEPYEAASPASDATLKQKKVKGQQQLENYKIAQETGKKTSIERLALHEKDGLECCEGAIVDNETAIDSQQQPHQQPEQQQLLVENSPFVITTSKDASQLELVPVIPQHTSPTTDTTKNHQQQMLEVSSQVHQNHQHDEEITLAVQINDLTSPPDVEAPMLAPAFASNKPASQVNQAPPVKVKVTSKAPESDGPPPFYVIAAIFMAACCLLFYCGIEITSMNYLATFAVNTDLQLSKSTAAYLSSALTSSFAVGRGFGIWIAISVKPQILFYICVAGVALGNLAMWFFANTNETLLWISLCFFGIGCGPMYPAIVSFYDEKISKVTNTVSGIFILASMFQVALSSLIVGHHIIDNALILIELNLISSVLLLVLFGSLHLLTKIKKMQRKRKLKAKELQAAMQNSV